MTNESLKIVDELHSVASYLGGSVLYDHDRPYIRIDTEDNTSKENYDDLLGLEEEIDLMLQNYYIHEKWADHNTQIIEFRKHKLNNENV